MDDDDRPFVIGEWNGLVQHRCRLCEWDTLEGEDAAWGHFREVHEVLAPPEPRTIQVFDRWGNPVR